MLYIFAGFPLSGLHAGGLRLLTETEGIGLLEEDASVQYRKEGVYIGEEWSRPIEYRVSDLCEREGIGWGWFPEKSDFGNGVTIHKTMARYNDDRVIHYHDDGTVTWEKGVEDRSEYEARWANGKCPQESHAVHLTWFLFKHRLPSHAYERLRTLVEAGAAPLTPSIYESVNEPGKYKSEARPLVFGKEQHEISGV